ncbi:hypothetical protein LguiB_012547 [Lonicera macranthoides]
MYSISNTLSAEMPLARRKFSSDIRTNSPSMRKSNGSEFQSSFPALRKLLTMAERPSLVRLDGITYWNSEPFDFLIDGELVRMSLENFLFAKGISAERVLEIEYIRAVVPRKEEELSLHDVWYQSRSNIPIIGWPLVPEQAHNAKMLVEEMRVCVEFARGRESVVLMEEVKRVIEHVMGENKEEMRKKACEIGELIRGAVTKEGDGGVKGCSLQAMDDFVSTLLSLRKNVSFTK